ncbi:IclR family transcriptional regulator [Microbacterium sp. NPDC087591]|jgi:IclR family acetate operon transcriptional repressor|uniref:IclR family transcriptional regulator n=1 Tax=Microbacterium sp. NPDC087591 TaxID=3364192 RepID=UPI00382D2275
MTGQGPKKASRVQSVERAIDILDALIVCASGATVTEVAARVGGSKSAVFATLQTLCARGLVRSAGTGMDRRYWLGLRLTYLGEIALSRVTLRDLAMPHLRALTDEVDLTSRVATRVDNYVVVVGRVEGASGIRFELHMGQKEYLHSSAVGKAILATLSDQEVARTVALTPMVRRTAKTIPSVPALLVDLSKIRERGFSIDDEEDADGVVCIGAPILDRSGRAAGAISVTRLKAGLRREEIVRVGRAVADHAKRISFALGNVNPAFGVDERGFD